MKPASVYILFPLLFSLLFLLLFLLGLFPVATPLQAANVAGVELPGSLEVAGQKLLLNGIGLREAQFIGTDIYVAGLYVKQKTQEAARIITSSETKHLIIQFVHDVDVSEIHEDLEEGFEKHGKLDKVHQPRLEALKKFMIDVKEGDRLTFTFHADKLEVTLPDGRASSFDGRDFSSAVLAIWIGEYAAKGKLKEALLTSPR